jgi:hypothetical protein
MMKRFCSIDKEGGFEMKGDPRLVYKIMVNTRLILLRGAGYHLYKAAKIATRYAAVRRQFQTISGTTKERKLIDYQTHLQVLGPQVAIYHMIMMSEM